MGRYDSFATALVNGNLPDWFYATCAGARLIPLTKTKLTPEQLAAGVQPDARPIAIGEVETRAIARSVAKQTLESAAAVLAPQQVAVGIKGGISILVHGIKLTLEQHPNFVMVRIDISNAFNEITRAVLLRRMAKHKEFAHIMTFLHKLIGPGADLRLGPELDRLFGDDDRADSAEGVPQGFPLSSMTFSVGIQPELAALDAELKPFGGVARAVADDIYAIGPASIVFPAVQRFCDTLQRLTGLMSNPAKCGCYSPQHNLDDCEWRAQAQIPLGVDSEGGRGLMVGGIPMGSDIFIQQTLAVKTLDTVNMIEDTCAWLDGHPHSLWALLFHCAASRLDYLLQHLPPEHTHTLAARLDTTLVSAFELITYDGALSDHVSFTRFRLPARLRGCGMRSRVELAPIAYVSSFATAAKTMIDISSVGGALLPGFFPGLSTTFGRGAFDPQGHRLLLFTTSQSAIHFRQAWDGLQQRVSGATTNGPLDDAADVAGKLQEHLQKAITKQCDQVTRDRLHAWIIANLDTEHHQRKAWMNLDANSSQWVPSWPTDRQEFSDIEMPEVMCRYLGRESPLVRGFVGGTIPIKDAENRPHLAECDAFGVNLGRATLPGSEHTIMHDNTGSELFNQMADAQVPTQLAPKTLFESLVPVVRLQARGMRAIIPDAVMDVALPAVATGVGAKRGARRPRRRLMFDVKTIHCGTDWYKHRTAEQCGAVRAREARVSPDYIAHAQKIDRICGAPGSKQCEQRLRAFSETRGLIFGAYGEASPDVHDLIAVASEAKARRLWRQAGARSQKEYQGYVTRNMRRSVGLATVQEQARHLIARVPLINVPRNVLDDVMADRRRQRTYGANTLRDWAPAIDHSDFYTHQQGQYMTA